MRSTQGRVLSAGLASVVGVSLMLCAGDGAAQPIEGFGSVTTGGAGGELYRVTTLADSGPGSLRYGLDNRSQKPLLVVFDVGGTIILTNDIIIQQPFLTIDGSTAPSPGITITPDWFTKEFIVGGTHDVILKSLRFVGLWTDGGQTGGNNATLIIDGDRKPDMVAQRVVLDHITVTKAGDSGPDIYGSANDITIQWGFFYANMHPTTVSGTPGGTSIRERISLHHNVYALTGERNPQLRGDVRTLDYVNNVAYGWGSAPKSNPNSGYGMKVRNEPDEPTVQGVNIVNNAFVALPNLFTAWGTVYGDKPGPDLDDGGPTQVLAQGQLYTASKMGAIWITGNILPPLNQDHYSTVPNPIPIAYPVTTWPATALKDNVLPGVGTLYRTAAEQNLLDAIAAVLAGSPPPEPGPSPTPTPTPTPKPTPTPTPKPTPKPTPSATPTPKPTPTPPAKRDPHHENSWDAFKRRVRQVYCEIAGC